MHIEKKNYLQYTFPSFHFCAEEVGVDIFGNQLVAYIRAK